MSQGISNITASSKQQNLKKSRNGGDDQNSKKL